MDEEFFDISPWGNNDDEEEEILNLKKEKFLLSPKMQNYKSSRKNLQEFLQKNQKEKTEKPHILLVKSFTLLIKFQYFFKLK